MIRNLVRATFLVGALAVAGATPALAQTPKLGIVNSQALLAMAPGTAEAMASFEQTMQAYDQELVALEEELQTLQDNLDRQSATMTASVRQQQAEQIQEKYLAYQLRQNELDQEAQATRDSLVGPIIERIELVVEEVRSAGGYAIIFDIASGPTVFAVDPALDVTQEVLDRLNAGAAPAATPTP